jgi:hypothetical protein
MDQAEAANASVPPSRLVVSLTIAERRRVMANLAALTDQYRALNHEIQRRDTLKWMLAR